MKRLPTFHVAISVDPDVFNEVGVDKTLEAYDQSCADQRAAFERWLADGCPTKPRAAS